MTGALTLLFVDMAYSKENREHCGNQWSRTIHI